MNLLVSLEADSKLPSSSSLCKNKGLRNKERVTDSLRTSYHAGSERVTAHMAHVLHPSHAAAQLGFLPVLTSSPLPLEFICPHFSSSHVPHWGHGPLSLIPSLFCFSLFSHSWG